MATASKNKSSAHFKQKKGIIPVKINPLTSQNALLSGASSKTFESSQGQPRARLGDQTITQTVKRCAESVLKL